MARLPPGLDGAPATLHPGFDAAAPGVVAALVADNALLAGQVAELRSRLQALDMLEKAALVTHVAFLVQENADLKAALRSAGGGAGPVSPVGGVAGGVAGHGAVAGSPGHPTVPHPQGADGVAAPAAAGGGSGGRKPAWADKKRSGETARAIDGLASWRG